MTSGNLSEEPIVSQEQDLERLKGLADWFLTHNRPIRTAVDDSVYPRFPRPDAAAAAIAPVRTAAH